MARQARPVADAYVDVPGSRLFTRVLGAGATVIAVHGGPDFDHEYLRPELDVLASTSRLVYYDQRGRGRSFTGEVPDVTVASEVADLDAVRAAVGAERVVVLAHSWGALVALEYAWANPGRVSRLVLMSPAPMSADGLAAFRKEAARRRTAAEAVRMEELRQDPAFQRGDLDLEAEYYRIHFRPAVRGADQLEKIVGRLRRAFTAAGVVAARTIEASLYDQTWHLPGYDLLARLRDLDVPTLVIASRDDFIPLAIAIEITGALANAELVVLEDRGHFAFLEDPDQVASLVARVA